MRYTFVFNDERLHKKTDKLLILKKYIFTFIFALTYVYIYLYLQAFNLPFGMHDT